MTVVAEFIRIRTHALMTVARRHGVPDRLLLEGTGLEPWDLSDPERELTLELECAVIANLQAHAPAAAPLPLEAGLDFYLAEAGPWGDLARSASTVGEGLLLAAQYTNEVPSSTFRIDVSAEGGEPWIWFDAATPAVVRAFVEVRAMVRVAMAAQELVGEPVTARLVRVAAPRPLYTAELERFARSPIVWDQPRTGLAVDPGLLARPLTADPSRRPRALQRCREALAEYEGRRTLAGRVRHVVADRLQAAGGAEVARALNMSERALRRGLAAEGTTFRQVVGQVRLRQADELLSRGLTVEQTAHRVGYADASAFTRAFKRWTGVVPEEWARRG